MRQENKGTIRKVKAAAATSRITAPLIIPNLDLPKVPEEVDQAIGALIVAHLTWAIGYFTKPSPKDGIVSE